MLLNEDENVKIVVIIRG